jgi:hypothetical protein
MQVVVTDFNLRDSANSQKIILSAANAQSTVLNTPNAANYSASIPVPGQDVLLTADVPCWIVQGVNPVAVADGTFQYIPANTLFRTNVSNGNRIGAIAGGAGNLYITPLG